ncbi:MAG: hypothetical protein II786_04630 [Muribaculaceae bacterium]|nr:hypothetical protein [Muribaculaceae bacterium]
MMKRLIVKTVIAIAVMALAVPANAQFGGLGGAIKARAKSKVEEKVRQKAYQATNPKNVADEITSAIPEKGDAQEQLECKVSGHDYKMKGKINHGKWSKHQSSTVTFTHIPATLDEFKEVQKVLGTEPQGAVALQVMAFEMFRRDQQLGTEALKLNNTPTNLSSTLRQLKEVLGPDDSYARPYLAAALMQGANPANAYTPAYPYQVKMKVDPNKKYQESELLDGVVIYLLIDSEGWDTNWRGVELVRPEDAPYYLVSNCPAMYTQCKKIKGKFAGLK